MKSTDRPRTIHCVGDSHASFFSGTWEIQAIWPEPAACELPGVFNYRLGAATAHNLRKPESSTSSWTRLWEVLDTISPMPEKLILLSFGEIDCRMHLLPQHEKTARPLTELVANTVGNYMQAVLALREAGYQTALWAPPPPTLQEGTNKSAYLCHGTYEERKRVTRMFNDQLATACIPLGVPCISLYNKLVARDGRTRREYFSDGIHLSPLALPMAARAISAACPNFRIPISPLLLLINPFRLLMRRMRLGWRQVRLAPPNWSN